MSVCYLLHIGVSFKLELITIGLLVWIQSRPDNRLDSAGIVVHRTLAGMDFMRRLHSNLSEIISMKLLAETS